MSAPDNTRAPQAQAQEREREHVHIYTRGWKQLAGTAPYACVTCGMGMAEGGVMSIEPRPPPAGAAHSLRSPGAA
jgi:hypothetical protein